VEDVKDEPLVWHYGLMAERWGEAITDAPEVPFYLREIERSGGPVLDVACGSGRVLIPLLAAGVDIDGCDISQDMLDQCTANAAKLGLEPNLYAQPMDAFDLPRRYRTIYICDSFGLAGSRERDLNTLRRCYEHLEDGGVLLINLEAEYNSPESWQRWLPDGRKELPEDWRPDPSTRVAKDGTEHRAYFRLVAVDPLEQTYTREVRLEKGQPGEVAASEQHMLRENIYLKQEVLLMLQVAGFRDVSVRGNWSDEPATADHEDLIFTATR
jgi:SAM-dependent methyltransferase